MKKVIIFGGALLGFTLVANAAWVRDGSVKSTEKSVSSLATLVEERSFVLGSLKTSAGPKAASIEALAGTFGGATASKAISTKWKDVATGTEMTEVNTGLVFAKNDLGDAPEAGTWAGAAFVAAVAFGGWRSRRVRG